MTLLRLAWARLLAFFRQEKLDREFGEELEAHLELAIDDHIRQGMTPQEARRQALIKLGGMTSASQLHRDHRGLPWLDGIMQDGRYALRALRSSKGVTLTAIATLAIGIGINATVFTIANAVLFKGFRFVKENDRILYIHTRKTSRPQEYFGLSYPDFQDWKAEAKSFEWMGACTDLRRTSVSDATGPPESYWGVQISADTFRLLGQTPLIGRDFEPSDEAPAAAPVAMLTYGLWDQRYGKDPAIVGRTIKVNGVPTAVIGVMAEGFSFPNKQDLWMPLTPGFKKRDGRMVVDDLWFAYGRLAPGATIQSAQAEMETIGHRLQSAYPESNEGFAPYVVSFQDNFHNPRERMTYVAMWGAVCFVLLIACANLANLMLARAMGRAREISVRIALGAGRWRIIRQLVLESLILSSAGGLLGWWIAKGAVRLYALAALRIFHATASPDVFPWHDLTMDSRVLGYLIAISAGTAILFGLAPANRLSKLDLNAVLKNSARGATLGRHGRRTSGLLVAVEMALTLMLLTGAGVMIRSFLKIYQADVGIKRENILTAWIELPESRYPNGDAQIALFDRLKAKLDAIPGVERTSIANRPPVGGSISFPYELDSAAAGSQSKKLPALRALIIGREYFQTLRAAVISGREFSDADRRADPVVMVNQRFANQRWPGENPLGKRLRLFRASTPGPWLTVVGVAPDIAQDFSRLEVDPLVYLPYAQRPSALMSVIVRTAGPPGNLANAFRREIQALDPDLPIFDMETLAVRFGGNYWFNDAVLFLIFAAIAVLLSAVGLYAVISHSVSQRMQEIGIRMAVGAEARDILGLVFRQGAVWVGIGLVAGLAGSFAIAPILRAALVQAPAADPITLFIASAVLVLAAALGCLVPARRALGVDPATALRQE